MLYLLYYIKVNMAKHSLSTNLPRRVAANLEIMGEQIRLARKRRGISIATIAERAQCSELTVIRAERGVPTVSIGAYARILYGLGLDEDLLLIAKDDPAGNTLINARLLRKNQKDDMEYDVFD